MTAVRSKSLALLKNSRIIDTILVVWHPEILKNFRTAPSTFADPPAGFEDNFEQTTVTIKDILTSYPNLSSDFEQQQALAKDLQDILLDGLSGQNLISKVRFSALEFSIHLDNINFSTVNGMAKQWTEKGTDMTIQRQSGWHTCGP